MRGSAKQGCDPSIATLRTAAYWATLGQVRGAQAPGQAPRGSGMEAHGEDIREGQDMYASQES